MVTKSQTPFQTGLADGLYRLTKFTKFNCSAYFAYIRVFELVGLKTAGLRTYILDNGYGTGTIAHSPILLLSKASIYACMLPLFVRPHSPIPAPIS